MLIYGHYDVQSPEPADRWTTPPFQPSLRTGRIYARGVVDDKGQLFMHLKALEAHLRTTGSLPVNAIVLLEGEEEIGSQNVISYVRQGGDGLDVDAVIVSDSWMWDEGLPAILVSLRGIVCCEIEVRALEHDVHSGSYGGAVRNSANVLAQLIASLHDASGRIAVQGFYDAVDAESVQHDQVVRVPFEAAAFATACDTSEFFGEPGYGVLERLWLRPTLDINGVLAGHTGPGPRTVIPARASAKLSCRLVARQDPDDIARKLEDHLRERLPSGTTLLFRVVSTARPWRADLGSAVYRTASLVASRHFGRAPVFVGDGGSIGVVTALQEEVRAPIILLGIGLPGCNEHAPEEWLSLENFRRGVHMMADFLTEV